MKTRISSPVLFFIILLFIGLAGGTASSAIVGYVTNSGAGTVSVIDGFGFNLLSTVTVSSQPFGVAINPAGTVAYVTNRGANTVSVIDTVKNALVTTIPVGSSPTGIAVSPSGTTVYVANSGSSTVSVIDAGTNAVKGAFAVGASPMGVVVKPDGSHVYVANSGSNTVSVIDTSTNIVTAVTVQNTPIGLAVKPDGTQVYVANSGSGSVSVIDTAANAVVNTFINAGATPFGIAVSPGGTTLYVTNNQFNSLTVINTAANTSSFVAVGVQPAGVAVNAGGTRIYVANTGSGNVTVVDAGSFAVLSSISVGANPVAFGNFITTVAPTVVSTTPANGATDVTLDTPITATFSVTMDPATITTSTFTVTDSAGNKISGTVTANSNTAQFTPSGTLPSNTTFIATLTTGVADASGSGLASNFSWTFATGTSTTSSGGVKCFIATAAYGSYLDPHVRVLRDFRDRFLLTNGPGRAFVAFYYRHSPPVADFISRHEAMKTATRWLITPVVYVVEYPAGLALIFVAGTAVIVRRKKNKKR